MSKDKTTEQDLYERAAARDVIEADHQVALACARDREALQVESLGDFCRYHGHDYATVFQLWRRGYLWPRRRDRTGLLKVSYSDALRAVLDEQDHDAIDEDVLDRIERETATTEGSES